MTGRPGERRDPETGEVFYSSAWLDDEGRVTPAAVRAGNYIQPAFGRRFGPSPYEVYVDFQQVAAGLTYHEAAAELRRRLSDRPTVELS
jgi:hypothetical protein